MQAAESTALRRRVFRRNGPCLALVDGSAEYGLSSKDARRGWLAGRAECSQGEALTLKTVDPLALAALGGADLEAHFLGQASANEASDGVGLPVHGVQDVLERGAVRALQHIDDHGLLAALARGGQRVVRFGATLAAWTILGHVGACAVPG